MKQGEVINRVEGGREGGPGPGRVAMTLSFCCICVVRSFDGASNASMHFWYLYSNAVYCLSAQLGRSVWNSFRKYRLVVTPEFGLFGIVCVDRTLDLALLAAFLSNQCHVLFPLENESVNEFFETGTKLLCEVMALDGV